MGQRAGKSPKTLNMTGQSDEEKLDLTSIRERLAANKNSGLWRSLSELAETKEFVAYLHHEFPRETNWVSSLSRRGFLKLLAAPLALAGLSACIPQPRELIVPYVEPPDELTPDRPLFFSTAMELNGFGRGLLVESRMGRPVKVEGNPLHPLSLGGTDAFSQASTLTLYDPNRAQVVTRAGQISTWESFLASITGSLDQIRGSEGRGLSILTGTVTSPTFSAQINALLEEFPQARWHQYDPVHRDNIRAGVILAFGQPVEVRYRVDAADVIVSLDSDFLFREPGSLRYIREFTSRRQVSEDQTDMNRLYVIESSLTNTGAAADHRLRLQAGQVEAFARSMAAGLGLAADAGRPLPLPEGWLEALIEDLIARPGASLILAGEQQPAVVHALAHAMNQELGNVGRTVFYTQPVEANSADQTESLRLLVEDLNSGQVDLLVIFNDNPVYSSPVDLSFGEALRQARMSVYWGLYFDETAALADWHVPAAHFLESWSDTRSYDGTATIIQPLIEPLYRGRSKHELLAALLGEVDPNGHDLVRQFWQSLISLSSPESEGSDTEFNQFWRQALRDGVVPGTSASLVENLTLRTDFTSELEQPQAEPVEEANTLEIIFEPDPSIWDGRFYNNVWLQELPKPVTKLTWDNAALVSPGTAQSLDLSNSEVVELRFQGRSIRAPVWILPGLPDNSVVVHLGYGQSGGGMAGSGHGFNAYALRTSDRPWFSYGLEISKTGETYPLASTQDHHSMAGRDLVRVATLAEFIENPEFAHEYEHLVEIPGQETGHDDEAEEEIVPRPPSIYPEFEYPGYAWGMAINLNSCTGCNACVLACQAENNIPVVGKEEVLNGREMHWLRIDRYFESSLDDPQVYFEPVLCMHCEKAPCEPVCPVAATVHSSEGLNEQVYSRCIGTRYCSHNCPYKVRRFNFYNYPGENFIPLDLVHNPQVTVRTRGVMEKCTYCVQRINAARIEAKAEGREILDGGVITACQQACPSQAIIFGDINNEASQVRKMKELPLNYGLLEELGTQPRTTYLAKVRNPNPRIEELGHA
jgi:MoCo/4Fe-4S cofactor protein with predicted Tat translocation signal